MHIHQGQAQGIPSVYQGEIDMPWRALAVVVLVILIAMGSGGRSDYEIALEAERDSLREQLAMQRGCEAVRPAPTLTRAEIGS